MDLPESFDISTFGGFNKKTVLKYIDELCESAKETEDELNAKIKEKEAESKNLKERVEALETAAAKHQDTKMTLEETIAELDRELRRQRSVAETYERELGEQKEQLRQLAVRSEGWESKSRKYDEAMSQIGGALMDARQGAAVVTKAAEEKALRIKQSAIENVHNLAAQVGGFQGDISLLRKALQMTMAELARRLDDLDTGILKLGTSVDEQLANYNQEPCAAIEAELDPIPEPPQFPEAAGLLYYETEEADELPKLPDEELVAPIVWEIGGDDDEDMPEQVEPDIPVASVVDEALEVHQKPEVVTTEVREEPQATAPPKFFW